MTHERFERRPVVIVGGLSDTEEGLRALAQPLALDHKLSVVPGRWDTVEPVGDKIARIRDSLAEIANQEGPLVAFGVSAGGPLTLVAAAGEAHVQGIATGASPLRRPEKMTKLLTLASKKYPGLVPLMESLVNVVLPTLSASDRERIITFQGTRDWKVPPAMSSIDGATNHTLPTPWKIPLPHHVNIVNALRSSELKGFITKVFAPRIA